MMVILMIMMTKNIQILLVLSKNVPIELGEFNELGEFYELGELDEFDWITADPHSD